MFKKFRSLSKWLVFKVFFSWMCMWGISTFRCCWSGRCDGSCTEEGAGGNDQQLRPNAVSVTQGPQTISHYRLLKLTEFDSQHSNEYNDIMQTCLCCTGTFVLQRDWHRRWSPLKTAPIWLVLLYVSLSVFSVRMHHHTTKVNETSESKWHLHLV